MFIIIALTLLGFTGNSLTLSISFGVSSNYTYILWNHPSTIVIFNTKILWIGVALKRRKSNLLLIDLVYWLLLGSLLALCRIAGGAQTHP